MNKSTLMLSVFAVMLIAMILSCQNPVNNAKNITGETKDINEANQKYLYDIEHYRVKKALTIELNSRNITVFKAKIDTKKEKCKYDYRQSIFKLELQNTYMKMKLDEYVPEGKEKWKIFKAKFTCQLDELSKEFTNFSMAV